MCEFIAFSCQFGIKLKSWGKNPMDYEAASLMNKQAVIDYSFPSSGSFFDAFFMVIVNDYYRRKRGILPYLLIFYV